MTESGKEDLAPIEMIRRNKLYLRHFRKHGFKSFVHKPTENSNGNLDSKSELGMFVGYCKHNENTNNSVLVETRHVTFNQGQFSK